MNVKELARTCGFSAAAGNASLQRPVTSVYCCDLLSFAMGRAPEDGAWITVMGNINSVAVASLADVACIVLSDGVQPDEAMLTKAQQQDIAVLLSDRPAFETGLAIHEAIRA